jgi:hypothetical protein
MNRNIEMPSEIKRLFVLHYMDDLSPCEIYSWTNSLLEKEVATECVRILAGWQPQGYFEQQDFYFYFFRCLRKLGWDMPEREQCLREYCQDLSRSLIVGYISMMCFQKTLICGWISASSKG